MQEAAVRMIIVAPWVVMCEKEEVDLLEKFIHCRDWDETLVEFVGKNGLDTEVEVYPTLTPRRRGPTRWHGGEVEGV